MELQNILDNHLVKRTLEIALIGDHSICLDFSKGDYDTALRFQQWGIEQGLNIITSHEFLPDYDICLTVHKPREGEFVSRDRDSDKALFQRVSNAQNYELVVNYDDVTKRLLNSAVKTLNLSQTQFEQIVDVAESIACLSGGEFEVVHVCEAIQYSYPNVTKVL